MIKIIIDQPSDSGTRFLCPTCDQCATRKQGVMTEEYWCYAHRFGEAHKVAFEVSSCSEYSRRDGWTSQLPEAMKSSAYYLDASEERPGSQTFVPYAIAKKRELI